MRADVSVTPDLPLSVVFMTAPIPPPRHIVEVKPDAPPDHLVEMVARVVAVDEMAHGPAGSTRYAEAARRLAREYVARIWAEAWHAGAVWHAARAPARLELHIDDLDPALVERVVRQTLNTKPGQPT